MPETQPELFEVPDTDVNVRWLERYLREHGGWVTGADLAEVAGKLVSDDSRRWVRMLAEASGWIISGQKGYKHLEHATADEVSHFVNWMESQGKKMIGRAERLKRNAHARVG